MSLIRLDRAAYAHNIEAIAKKVGTKERIILVLKDNAYAHGISLIAPEAARLGVEFVAVKSEGEARAVAGYFRHVLVLSHIPNGSETDEFIYAINELNALKKIAPNSRIHLVIDTLMHRNGIKFNELDEALEIISKRGLLLLGAYTHFRSSDEISCDYFIQRQVFNRAKNIILSWCEKNAIAKPLFHSHNSGGLERFHDLSDELVRVGIAQYGYAQFDSSLGLKRVLSLWASRVSVRDVLKGERVGYGGIWTSDRACRVATYDLGYGDGLLRYSGEGELRMRDGARLLGKMSMDSFGAEDAGEMVCVFDDARVWARHFGTIEYDVLTKLSPFIPRVWV